MKKVKSRVFSNLSLRFNNGIVKFNNGVAEISDEIYNEIVERKFPDIYLEGEEPEYRMPLEGQLRKEVSEGNKEFEAEINRLKNIIESLKLEISMKNDEIASWKKSVERLSQSKPQVAEAPKPTIKEEMSMQTEEVEDELYKELKEMTVKELIEMAMTEEGGAFEEKDLKNKKKEEIINMIVSRS